MMTSYQREYSVSSMAAVSDSDDEATFLQPNHPVKVRPYMFEPRIIYQGEHREVPAVGQEDRTDNINWCSCSQCISMPTPVECCCCQELQPVKEKLQALDTQVSCITQHPGFDPVCLNPYTLETAYVVYKREHGRMQCTLHEKYRYTAYHQLVRWCWGIMGRKVRVPLPSCAVHKIRETYPEGGRVGFKWPDLD